MCSKRDHVLQTNTNNIKRNFSLQTLWMQALYIFNFIDESALSNFNNFINSLSANPTKWSNTFRKFVCFYRRTACVLDHSVGLALKGLRVIELNVDIFYKFLLTDKKNQAIYHNIEQFWKILPTVNLFQVNISFLHPPENIRKQDVRKLWPNMG